MNANDKIVKHLKYSCENWNDIWRSSIYGEPCKDDRDKCNIDSEVELADDPPDIDISIEFLEQNFCAITPRCFRVFCTSCETNFKKVKYFLDRNETHLLADNWDLEYDSSVELKTIRNIQTHEKFLETNGFVIDSSWTTYKFDSYFDNDLTPYLYDLFDYDIVDLGWYFNQSVEPLTRLPNLKGLICGYWFNQDLNPLKDLKGLKYIRVQGSYNRRLDDKIYKITYS